MPPCMPKCVTIELLSRVTEMSRSKHVQLTLACYPRSKAASARPNSSEMQYLVYYTSSRPKKLIKVGAFIRQKIAKDLYWNRQRDIIVSLQICTTLVEKCHANLSLFAGDMVAIMLSAVDTKDMQQIQSAKDCFAMFANFHNGSALTTDASFRDAYHILLSRFCNFINQYDLPDYVGLSTIGLDAILCACESPAMRVPNNSSEIRLAVLPLFETLRKIKDETLYTLRQQIDRHKPSRADDHQSSKFDTNTGGPSCLSEAGSTEAIPQDADALPLKALKILRSLCDVNDAVQLREVTINILHGPQWCKPPWISTILQLAADWAPIDLRFHIINACLNVLSHGSSSGNDTPSQHQILFVLHSMLTSRVNFIGLSTTDVLDSLLTIVLTAKQQHSSDASQAFIAESRGILHTGHDADSLNERIIETISALASHSYYKDQICDLVGNIMKRLHHSQNMEDVQLENLHYVLLAAAESLIRKAYSNGTDTRSFVPISTLEPSLFLLVDSNARLRNKCLLLFLGYLNTETHRMSTLDLGCNDTARNVMLVRLQASFLKSQIYWEKDLHEAEIWLAVIEALLHAISKRDAITFIPLVYQIESSISTENPPTTTILIAMQQKALVCILSKCLGSSVAFRFLEPFSGFVSSNHSNECQSPKNIEGSHTQFVLPGLPQLIEVLSKDEALGLSPEQWTEMLRPNSQEMMAQSLSRTTSVRLPQKSKFISSTTTSREQLPTPSLGSPNYSFEKIDELKKRLELPQDGNMKSSKTNGRIPTSNNQDLCDLFQGLEMEELS